MITRREFTSRAGLLLSGLGLVGRASASGLWARGGVGYFVFEPAGAEVNGARCLVAGEEGGNALAIVARDGLTLVDSKNAGFGAALRRDAEALGAPARLLINTHHHADHTGGNPAFGGDVPILAHPAAKARVGGNVERAMKSAQAALGNLAKSTKPGAADVAADVKAFLESAPTAASFEPTLTTDGGTRDASGVRVELHHFGPGHTDNDLVVRLPEFNLIHAGDLFFNRVWPYVDRGGGCSIPGWIGVLSKVEGLCDASTIVVPGHGAVSNREGVRAQRAMLEAVWAKAQEAAKAGTSRDEFLTQPVSEAEGYAASDWIRPITLGGAWDEATGAR